jgi:hypothetical protein
MAFMNHSEQDDHRVDAEAPRRAVRRPRVPGFPDPSASAVEPASTADLRRGTPTRPLSMRVMAPLLARYQATAA